MAGMEAAGQNVPNARSFRWAWLSVLLVASLIVTHSFAHFTGLEHSYRASLEMMVDGTAYRPYAGRMLIPMMIRGIESATPQFALDVIWAIFSHNGLHPEFLPFNFHEFIFECLAVICIFLSAIYARRCYAIAYRASIIESSVAALLYILGIPLWFRYYNYIYDPATI